MPDLTASDEVLLAATKLAGVKAEFTEWDLTVETWNMNKKRWGLRGYEEDFPDHKRVMNVIMGKGSIVHMGLLERPRTNHYRVTPAGLSRAVAITAPRDTRQRSLTIYDAVEKYAFHRVFDANQADSQEPRTWLGAAAFLNLPKNDPDLLETQLKNIKRSISDAEAYIKEHALDALRRGDATGKRAISRDRLEKLRTFVAVLESRFQPQLEAIRRKDVKR